MESFGSQALNAFKTIHSSTVCNSMDIVTPERQTSSAPILVSSPSSTMTNNKVLSRMCITSNASGSGHSSAFASTSCVKPMPRASTLPEGPFFPSAPSSSAPTHDQLVNNRRRLKPCLRPLPPVPAPHSHEPVAESSGKILPVKEAIVALRRAVSFVDERQAAMRKEAARRGESETLHRGGDFRRLRSW